MPHLRKRHLQLTLEKIVQFSPLVGVLGHRQVGKTTLLEDIAGAYFTFDNQVEREAAEQSPDQYLKERREPLTVLDECQVVPKIFPALKDRVRLSKKPGQYLLSGSVRFTSRKAIQESLTGRIINLELHPLTLSELTSRKLPNICRQFMTMERVDQFMPIPFSSKAMKNTHCLMEQYFEQGGLPGVCFIRNSKLRSLKFEDQIRTLLDRDIRMVYETSIAFSELRNFCVQLAQTQGVPLHWNKFSKETGISTPTLKKLLFALEAVFIIRIIPVEGGTKGPIVYFEDQGEQQHLSGLKTNNLAKVEHFLFTQIRAEFSYDPNENPQYFQYRTRGGAYVPFAVRTENGIIGFRAITRPGDWKLLLSTANSFLKSYPQGKIIFSHTDSDATPFSPQPRILVAPVGYLV